MKADENNEGKMPCWSSTAEKVSFHKVTASSLLTDTVFARTQMDNERQIKK